MNDDVEVSVPSVQLTGVPELTGNRYGYCGNDFGAVRDLPASIISTCRELVRSVGIYLAREGYVGIFGVDLAIDHAHAHILEVNPRLQGSTWLLGLLEVGSGLVPSVVKHYQALLNGRGPVSQGGEPPAGSVAQAILHLQSNDARRVSHSLRCGVYSSGSDGALTYVRKASWPLVLSTHEVFLFGLPRTGTVVESGAVLARVACSRRLALADGRALTNGGRAIVGAIHGAFVLHSP
jgi:hypothetical protein